MVVPLGGAGHGDLRHPDRRATEDYFKDFFKRPTASSIFLGMIIGIMMLLNVWMVIWPNQKIVIANAANVLGWQGPEPGAAAAGRRALLAVPPEHHLLGVDAVVHGGDDRTSTRSASPATVSSGKVAGFLIISL